MANNAAPLLLLGAAALLLMGKKKKKRRPPATVDDELSRPETDPESAPEQPYEPDPAPEWEPDPAPEWELPPEWEPAPAPSPDAPEEEGFKCERMLYNGYCIETREFTGNYHHISPWSVQIKDADGAILYSRGGVMGFQSEGEALHHAYSIIHEWAT